MKTNIDFKDQAWVRPPAKCWVKNFILPRKYHAPKFLPKILAYFSWLKMQKLTIISRAII